MQGADWVDTSSAARRKKTRCGTNGHKHSSRGDERRGIVGVNTVEIALDETPQAEGGRESDQEPCKCEIQRLPSTIQRIRAPDAPSAMRIPIPGNCCGFSYPEPRQPTIMTANSGASDCSVRIASRGILRDWQYHLALRIIEKLGGGRGVVYRLVSCELAASR